MTGRTWVLVYRRRSSFTSTRAKGEVIVAVGDARAEKWASRERRARRCDE